MIGRRAAAAGVFTDFADVIVPFDARADRKGDATGMGLINPWEGPTSSG